MSKTIVPLGAGLCVLVLFAAVLGIPINDAHIEARGHTQAQTLLPAYKAGVCEGKWVGYNIASGEILVACGVPDTHPPQCLLVGYRVTENAGATILGSEAYNTTAYVTDCYKAYKRSGFMKWSMVPIDLRASIVSVFGRP